METSALQLVKDQAQDEGLWFNAETASEAYLQQALRALHDAVEREENQTTRGKVMKLEIGKTYLIKHSRKGSFIARVIGADLDFTYAIIVGGKAEALLKENERHAGESVSFRTSFVTSAVEQPGKG